MKYMNINFRAIVNALASLHTMDFVRNSAAPHLQSSHRCRCRCEARGPRRLLRLSRFDVTLNAADQEALFHALCRDGAVLVRPLDSARLADTISACFRACGGFFARPFEEKTRHYAGAHVGQAHGYMDYLADAEGSECFEAKLHYDSRFEWPSKPTGLRVAIEAAADVQRRTGLWLLDAVMLALGFDQAHVDGLVDSRRAGDDDERPAYAAGKARSGMVHASGEARAASESPEGIALRSASHSALRVWQYTHGQPSGWHCDNTLLTLAPRGSSVGLEVRSPLDGRSFSPESSMSADELLVFAGDSLSYLSSGRVPALMHRVVPPPPPPISSAHSTAHADPPRLSCPFFLRARRSATLEPRRVELVPRRVELEPRRVELEPRRVELEPRSGGLPPLLVAALEHNADNLRSRWPWKCRGPLAEYYSQGVQWHAASRVEGHESQSTVLGPENATPHAQDPPR